MARASHAPRLVAAGASAAALFYLPCLLASWHGGALWWGLGFAAFLPAALRIALFLLPPLLAAALFFPRRSLPAPGPAPRWLVPAVIAATTLALHRMRDSLHLLGDGQLIENAVSRGSLFSRSAPLANRIYNGIFHHFGGADGSPRAVLENFSVALAPLFLVLAWLAVRELVKGSWNRAAAFALFVFQPTLLAYAGYIEFYPLIWIALLATIYLTLLARRGRAPGWAAVAAALLGVVLYVPSVIVLPPVLVALYGGHRRRGKSPGRSAARIGRDFVIGLVLTALVAAPSGMTPGAIVHALIGDQGSRFLPIAGPDGARHPYSLFSVRHFVDVANEIVLVMPLLLLVPVLLARRRGGRLGGEAAFLAATGLVALLPFFFLEAALGFACDWDQKAFSAIPLQLLAVHLLGREGAAGRRGAFPALVVFLVAFSMLRTCSWIALNADSDRSLARIEAIAREERLNSRFARSYIYEHLLAFHDESGDAPAAYDAVCRAAALRPGTPRLDARAGYLAVGLGRLDEGADHFTDALAADPRFLPAATGSGIIDLLRGALDGAERWFHRSLQIDRADRQASCYLAVTLIRRGETGRMLRELEKIPRYVDGGIAGTQLDGLAGDLERGGFPDEAAVVRRLLSPGPDAADRRPGAFR